MRESAEVTEECNALLPRWRRTLRPLLLAFAMPCVICTDCCKVTLMLRPSFQSATQSVKKDSIIVSIVLYIVNFAFVHV